MIVVILFFLCGCVGGRSPDWFSIGLGHQRRQLRFCHLANTRLLRLRLPRLGGSELRRRLLENRSSDFLSAFRRDAKNNFVGMARLSSRLLDAVNDHLQKSSTENPNRVYP